MAEESGSTICDRRTTVRWALVCGFAAPALACLVPQRAWAQPFRQSRAPTSAAPSDRALMQKKCIELQNKSMSILLDRRDARRARDLQQKAYTIYVSLYGKRNWQTITRRAIVTAHDKIVQLPPERQRQVIEAIRWQQLTRILENRARDIRERNSTPEESIDSQIESEKMLRMCLKKQTEVAKVLRDTLGRYSSFSAVLFFERGNIELSLGYYKRSRASLAEAAAISAKVYGKSHVLHARDMCELAWINMQLGNFEKAQKQLEVTYPIYERSLSERNTLRIIAMCDLAVCRWRLQDGNPTGKEFARRVHQLAKRLRVAVKHPAGVPDHIADLNAVVQCLSAIRFYHRAEFASRLLLEEVAKVKKDMPKAAIASLLAQHANILKNLGRWTEAVLLLRNAQ